MTQPSLADILDEVGAQLIASVAQTMTPTTVALPLRRTIERLPGLLRDFMRYMMERAVVTMNRRLRRQSVRRS